MTNDLHCHYCSHETAATNGAVVGWLIEMRPAHANWARPVCAKHVMMPPGYNNPQVLQYLEDAPLPESGEACGAYAVTEWDHGSPSVLRWCERRSGPCPFPGAATESARPCVVIQVAHYEEQLRVARQVCVSLAARS